MEKRKFTIAYYTGEEFDRPQLKEQHESIKEAARWCQRNYIPFAVVEITEWKAVENSASIALSSCSLKDAYESQMESLPK